MAKANLTKAANISVAAREIDFVTRFAKNWDALRQILGIMRPIKKQPGTKLSCKKATIVLQSGAVGEGEEIPYSQASVTTVPYGDMSIEKYAKAVSIESIKEHGYDVAVAKTDNAFLNELQGNVMNRFYAFLKTGELTASKATFQAALAAAKGLVVNKFKNMHVTVTETVAFVNVLDVYDYLATANITVQTKFGFQYIKDFMGFSTVFLLSDSEIPRGKIIATPVENIVLYYVDPSDSEFAKAGLEYRTDGVTNLIGFHVEGNYRTAVSESYALMGLTLFAEYIDGIAVVTVGASNDESESGEDKG